MWLYFNFAPIKGPGSSFYVHFSPNVVRLYCKRPIQCLASSKILTPTPSPPGVCVLPCLWYGGKTHSLGGEGVGVNILEDARHSSVLYICKYFVSPNHPFYSLFNVHV